MTEEAFVRARAPEWDELAMALGGTRPLVRQPPERMARVITLYRSLCADLMRAEGAGFGPDVTGRLHELAANAHAAIYQAPPRRRAALRSLLQGDFPRALRLHARLFALSAALFVLPGIIGFAGASRSRSFALRIVPEETAAEMEQAYAEGFGKGRDEGVDSAMAGFYINHNVGIAFRCFASGVLFGLGSAFFLVFNGLQIGAVMGLVKASGHGRNIFLFVVGHSSFELTAIVVAGTAGLVMGRALLVTDGLTRFGSLRRHTQSIVQLVGGAAFMLVVAAGIEGFWSPSGVRPLIKILVGGGNAVLVASYLAFAGRDRRRAA